MCVGKLEIGGFKFKKTLQNPPELMLEGEIQKLTSWAEKLAQALPRVKVLAPDLTVISKNAKLVLCIQNETRAAMSRTIESWNR